MKEGTAVSEGFGGVEPAPEPEKESKRANNGTGCLSISSKKGAGDYTRLSFKLEYLTESNKREKASLEIS